MDQVDGRLKRVEFSQTIEQRRIIDMDMACSTVPNRWVCLVCVLVREGPASPGSQEKDRERERDRLQQIKAHQRQKH